MCYIIDEKENECYGKHNFNCANFVCTKDQYNCHYSQNQRELSIKKNILHL